MFFNERSLLKQNAEKAALPHIVGTFEHFLNKSVSESQIAAVDVKALTGDVRGLITAQVESELGDLVGAGHASDGLYGGQFGKHLVAIVGVVAGEVAVDEGSVDAGRTDRVAADLVLEVVGGDGEGHGVDSPLARRVGEPIPQPGDRGDAGHVEDDPSAGGDEFGKDGLETKVNAFDIDLHDAVKIALAGGRGGADIGDPGVVDENIDFAEGPFGGDDGGGDGFLIGDIAAGEKGAPTGGVDRGEGIARGGFVEIKDGHGGSGGGKRFTDGASDPGASSGDDRGFVFELGHGPSLTRIRPHGNAILHPVFPAVTCLRHLRKTRPPRPETGDASGREILGAFSDPLLDLLGREPSPAVDLLAVDADSPLGFGEENLDELLVGRRRGGEPGDAGEVPFRRNPEFLPQFADGAVVVGFPGIDMARGAAVPLAGMGVLAMRAQLHENFPAFVL